MKPLQVIIKTAIVVISILAMAGCGSGSGGSNGDGDVITDTVSATGVTLNRETLTMAVSDTYQLTATVTPDNAGNKTVSWSSNTTSVATVDENGLVTALAVGSATITVTTEDGDYSDSCVVTVMTDPIPVTGVDLNTETLTIDVGDTYQLTAMVIPDNASNKTVSWSSDTDSVATVDQNGTVTAVAEGTATITVISEEGEHSDSCEVTVTPVDVIGITLDRETLALSINDTFQLAATIVPNNATNKNVTWSTGAASVATVDQNGLVTALAQGTAVITVTTEDGGHTDSCTITVIAVYDEGAFITVWDLSLSTIPTPLLLIPLNSTGNYDFTIDWGDGTVETYSGLVHNDVDHEYTDKGVYTVVITGICQGFGSTATGVPSDNALVDILRWGDVGLHNQGYQFAFCTNLATISAPDVPNLSGITNLTGMFYQCQTFNADLSGWDTSAVTTMFRMFNDAFAFNGNIGTWDTGMVTNMGSMFRNALEFNQDLSGWNTASVTDMSQMFYGARVFNGNISTWDTGNVTSMNNMFRDATAFNTDISSWDTSQVEDMGLMFSGASSFNSNISRWNTSSVMNMTRMFMLAESFNHDLFWDTSRVTNMGFMFRESTAFNGDISEWDTSQVTDMSYMFFMAENFNRDISAWNTANVGNMSYMFRGAELFNQDISLWDTGNVINMDNMFNGAAAFNSDLSNWDISNVTNMFMMFYSASSFTNGGNPTGLNGWTLNASCNTANMFRFCLLTPLPDWYTP